jgi:hypothetical protein
VLVNPTNADGSHYWQQLPMKRYEQPFDGKRFLNSLHELANELMVHVYSFLSEPFWCDKSHTCDLACKYCSKYIKAFLYTPFSFHDVLNFDATTMVAAMKHRGNMYYTPQCFDQTHWVIHGMKERLDMMVNMYQETWVSHEHIMYRYNNSLHFSRSLVLRYDQRFADQSDGVLLACGKRSFDPFLKELTKQIIRTRLENCNQAYGYRYAFLPAPGDAAVTTSSIHNVMCYINLPVVLKAFLLANIPMVGAASLTETTFGFTKLIDFLLNIFTIILFEIMMAVDVVFDTILDTVEKCDQYQFDIILFLIIGMITYKIYKLWTRKRMAKQQKTTKTALGLNVISIVERNGKKYVTLSDGEVTTEVEVGTDLKTEQKLIPTPEMAMAGSVLVPASFKPGVGAILIATTEGLKVHGCFWRYKSYFITARHVANKIQSGIYEVYIAPLKVLRNKTVVVDDSKTMLLSRSFFEADANEFTTVNRDVFMKSQTEKFWSQLGLQSANVKLPSSYNLQITAVGFDGDKFVCSTGITKKSEDHMELWHSATTKGGFSGSPIFCGTSVIGMHVSGCPNHNVMLRQELVLRNVVESNDVWSSTQPSINQEDTTRFTDDGQEYIERANGELADFADYMEAHVKGPRWADYASDEEDFEPYDNGEEKLSVYARFLRDEDSNIKPYSLTKGKMVHLNEFPSQNEEVTEFFKNQEAALTKCGFEHETYGVFENSRAKEYVSLLKHVELHAERSVNPALVEPSAEEIKKMRYVLSEMLKHNRYIPDKDYKSIPFLMGLIDSPLIKKAKSAGRPYIEQGLVLIKDVIKHFSLRGMADTVLRLWNAPLVLRVFNKTEPHKIKKLLAEMYRIITGFPAHKTIKHMALFRNLNDKAVMNWMLSPIKYAFSPLVPGHLIHLWRWLSGRPILESDKSNWDFNVLKWMYVVLKFVIDDLIIDHPEWTEEEAKQYRIDVAEAIDEVFKQVKYQCSNGIILTPEFEGIIKSGWVLTIFANSLLQLILHVLVMIRLGLAKEILKDEWKIIVGGDDVLQNIPEGFDVSKYMETMKTLGVDIKAFHLNPSMEGIEFFSNKLTSYEGFVRFEPVRFTKHVYKLSVTKMADLKSALISHMQNYCFDNRFSFFLKMYRHFHKLYPEQFPMEETVSRELLKLKVYGVESL